MGCSSSQPEAPRQPTTPQHKYTNDLARARWRRAIRLVIASNKMKRAGFERRLRAGQEADLSDPTKEKPQRQSSRRPCGVAAASEGGRPSKPEPLTVTTVPPLVGPAGGSTPETLEA